MARIKYSIERNPGWKQDDPRAQLAVLIQSVQGNLSNAYDGMRYSKNQIKISLDYLAQCQDILRMMPDGSWEDFKKIS